MLALYEQIKRVAPTEATVMVVGESGTGKESVAHAIHELSPRHAGPFVAVNCGAIPPQLVEAELLGFEKGSFTGADRQRIGHFERAHGGTIFLDEVTEIPADVQVKLLRVLESRAFQRVGGSELIHIDVRIVAAANRDIGDAVAKEQFRADLMYRLAVFPLRVPPLRERGGDIAALAQHFLDGLNAHEGTRKTLSRRFLDTLAAYDWPGNVRELKNLVTRAFILADGVLEIPPVLRRQSPDVKVSDDGRLEISVGTPLDEAQRQLILATLEHCGGDKRRAAKLLGVSLKTLYNRLDAYRKGGTPESSAG
jgi:DNA-binding NtrC family response regulator